MFSDYIDLKKKEEKFGNGAEKTNGTHFKNRKGRKKIDSYMWNFLSAASW